MLASALNGCGDSGSSSDSSASQNSGNAGSMARFQIIDNYLYAITSSWQLSLFDITTPTNPTKWKDIYLANGIETLFQYKNYLFIGANDGIYIYDNQTPSAPFYISSFSHVQSCDPVVVANDIAYATLRGGNSCRTGANQLDIIDLKDIYQPQLVNSINMSNPKGLGISSNDLFVCDQNNLIHYDITDRINIKEIDRVSIYGCYDVIPLPNKLIVSHVNGISQYDTTRSPISFISDIATLQ